MDSGNSCWTSLSLCSLWVAKTSFKIEDGSISGPKVVISAYNKFNMKISLPPALVMFLFGVLMFILARFLPFGDFDFFGRMELVYFLFGLGLAVIFVAVFQFTWKKTTMDPLKFKKTSSLVKNGIYRYTRNPMYLGMLLFLLAFGLKLGNAFNTLLAAGFVSYMNRFQIKREEKILMELFGKEYRIYCKETRRWF